MFASAGVDAAADAVLSRMPVDAEKRVGLATVLAYINAIVDLYTSQIEKDGCFNRAHPRGPYVQALVKKLKGQESTLKRERYDDRGAGTIADGYSTTEEMKIMVDYFFSRNTVEGLRNCTSFLLAHYGLLRGESVRKMEFADLQTMLLENEGVTDCHALIMVLLQGKTNQEGRVEFAACIRNAKVQICPQMILSVYLFCRWHVRGELFPSFNTNKDWYRHKLIKTCGSESTAELSYPAHLAAISTAFKEVGLHSKAKTHAMRGSGARMAESLGTSEASIQRLGRWNSNALSKKYLTNIPREALRTLAGFTREAGQFYLPRAVVYPCTELRRKVFPWVDHWRERLDSGDVEQSSLAADGFLKLLEQLRVVFLQDSVLMKKQYPHHFVWKDPLFQDPLYEEFERYVALKHMT